MAFSADTWIALAALIVAAAWPVFQFFTKTTAKDEADEANAETIKVVEAQRLVINEHEVRLVRLEEQMKALPSQRDHAEFLRSLGAVQGDIKAISQTLEGLRNAQERTEREVRLVNETLMDRATFT